MRYPITIETGDTKHARRWKAARINITLPRRILRAVDAHARKAGRDPVWMSYPCSVGSDAEGGLSNWRSDALAALATDALVVFDAHVAHVRLSAAVLALVAARQRQGCGFLSGHLI